MTAPTNLTVQDLIQFSDDVAVLYNSGEIRAPVHLDGGNERNLIRVFEKVGHGDWVCGSWRMHYKCLLKGVPYDELIADIREHHSIALCYPEYRIISSAIVGGIIPIALGLAWSIKRAGGQEKVWVFCGDMTAATGMFDECFRYACGHDLPLMFVVEDNGKSVCTDTREVWGRATHRQRLNRFRYNARWPHAGAGQWVRF